VEKISNTDFSILKNDFLEICLLKTVISKKTWDPQDPLGMVVGFERWVEWWWGHVIRNAIVTQNRVLILNSKKPFLRFEITVFKITVFEITVFEVKPSYHESDIRCQLHQHSKYSFYAHRSWQHKKIQLSHWYLFTLSGSASVKSVWRMLMKLSPVDS